MGAEEEFGGSSLLEALKVQGRPLDVVLWTLETLKGLGSDVCVCWWRLLWAAATALGSRAPRGSEARLERCAARAAGKAERPGSSRRFCDSAAAFRESPPSAL